MAWLQLLSAGAMLALVTGAQAGNTSSNSSSNSSNGVHTRVDTIVTEDGRGRRVYERRTYRRDRAHGSASRHRRMIEDGDD